MTMQDVGPPLARFTLALTLKWGFRPTCSPILKIVKTGSDTMVPSTQGKSWVQVAVPAVLAHCSLLRFGLEIPL